MIKAKETPSIKGGVSYYYFENGMWSMILALLYGNDIKIAHLNRILLTLRRR